MANEKLVPTVWGSFGKARLDALRETLESAEKEGMSRDEVTTFEGNEMLISFGYYLLEHIETEYSKRNYSGL